MRTVVAVDWSCGRAVRHIVWRDGRIQVVLLLILLFLGSLNFLIVKQHPATLARLLPTVRRFAEGEGFISILAAASLTSQPPAVDLPDGRMSAAEMA